MAKLSEMVSALLSLLFVVASAPHVLHDPHGPHGHHEAHGPSRLHAHGQRGVDALEQAARALIEAAESDPPLLPQDFVHEFDDPRRRTIDFFPLAARADQRGFRLGLMRMGHRRATHGLLRGLLSEEGYLRTQAIRSLEGHLRETLLETSFVRVPDAYTVQIFGEPGPELPWAFKFEGHHLSINATVVDGELRGTPLFLGASPAELLVGPDAGLRVLALQEDLGRRLLASLDAGQRERAVVAEYDPEALIPLGRLADPAAPAGLSAAEMTVAQRALLVRLVASYVRNLRASFADDALARLEEAGVEALRFQWRGGTQVGEPFSYVVHGPTVLLQLDAVVDVPGQPANHLHALWRDPERDFGRDLLAEHHRREHR